MITTGSSFTLAAPAHAVAQAVQPQKAAPSHHFSFGDFLDIVNPLQHIPVIGTLYRAITGDTIDTPEKIVGDTLYGGPLGAVSSIAEVGFKEITGKDFGDTILSWFTGKHSDKAKALADSAPQAAPVPAQASAAGQAGNTEQTNATADVSALRASLDRSGLDPAIAQRALFAYRRSLTTGPSFLSED